MKPTVRVGLGLGLGEMWNSADEFAELVCVAEASGWDSLWFSEHLTGPTPAAFPQIAFAAALTKKMQLGTSVTVVPGRSPVELAKTLVTLNDLCNGRLLPILGLGIAEPDEHQAFMVDRQSRGPWLDAALPLIRRMASGERVTHRSEMFELSDIGIGITGARPIRSIWMGGRSDAELKRTGRLADGWLASFATPSQTRRSIEIVESEAAIAGRTIDSGHFGLLFPYDPVSRPARMAELLANFHPEDDPNVLCPVGSAALHRILQEHAEAGISKFILVPAGRPANWQLFLTRVRADVNSALYAINSPPSATSK